MNYSAPAITEIGSVADLTRGTGDDHTWDSAYGLAAGLGFVFGDGGRPSGSAA
jgi:hypothetical protein